MKLQEQNSQYNNSAFRHFTEKFF